MLYPLSYEGADSIVAAGTGSAVGNRWPQPLASTHG